jgi:hypothetical protein
MTPRAVSRPQITNLLVASGFPPFASLSARGPIISPGFDVRINYADRRFVKVSWAYDHENRYDAAREREAAIILLKMARALVDHDMAAFFVPDVTASVVLVSRQRVWPRDEPKAVQVTAQTLDALFAREEAESNV